MLDEIAEGLDLRTPPLGGRAGGTALDAGLLAVEFEGFEEIDLLRGAGRVLRQLVGGGIIQVPRDAVDVQAALPPGVKEQRQEACVCFGAGPGPRSESNYH